jgi:hypothetical protein
MVVNGQFLRSAAFPYLSEVTYSLETSDFTNIRRRYLEPLHGGYKKLRSEDGAYWDLHGEGRLVLIAAVFQCLLHMGCVVVEKDLRTLMPHLVSFLHDLMLIVAVSLLFAVAGRLSPARFRFTLRIGATSCLLALMLILASYPRFLRAYLAFPVNIFATDAGSSRVFLDYVGLAAFWPIALAAIAGVFALVVPFQFRVVRRTWVVTGFLIILVSLLSLFTPSPQPFLFSMQQEFTDRLGGDSRAVPRLKRALERSNSSACSVSSSLVLSNPLRADHLLLIVLEGVTARTFEDEFMTRRNGFYERVRPYAAYFSHYYSTNLDSYPSLIAMLTSRQVPYLAYADESLYTAVNHAANLTRTLRAQGSRTMFVCTAAYQPFVPTRRDWDRIVHRDQLGSLEGWARIDSNRIDAGVEDRAALSLIFDFMTGGERSFVLHELVFGHSTEWRSASGKSQLEYYDLYLNEVLDNLQHRGLDGRTLLVIVSDHGDRAKSSSMENYRVPLLVVGRSVTPLRDDRFRSHLDIQAIVAHYLSGAALPSPRQESYVVGSSERWVYGRISADGEHLFIDDRTGRILSQRGSRDPLQFYHQFQAVVDEFDGCYGK